MSGPIRKNDLVQVISGNASGRMTRQESGEGRDVGFRGRVVRVLRKKGTAVIQGTNVVTKAVRPNPSKGEPGGFKDTEMPVHLSNLMLVCGQCDRPVRVKRVRNEEGKRVRVCRKCGAEV